MESTAAPVRVVYYFDPLCAWSWLTSLWLRRVRRTRPIEIQWRFFSLAGESDDVWQGPLRTAALARREGGNDAVDMAYLALGRLFHERPDGFDLIHDLADAARPYLDEVGLDPSLAARALADHTTLDDVLDDRRRAEEQCGAFGVPWLLVGDDERGFFGPVIGEALSDQEAVELWEHFSWLAARPYLYELKRGQKSMQSLAGLSDTFLPAAGPVAGGR